MKQKPKLLFSTGWTYESFTSYNEIYSKKWVVNDYGDPLFYTGEVSAFNMPKLNKLETKTFMALNAVSVLSETQRAQSISHQGQVAIFPKGATEGIIKKSSPC